MSVDWVFAHICHGAKPVMGAGDDRTQSAGVRPDEEEDVDEKKGRPKAVKRRKLRHAPASRPR